MVDYYITSIIEIKIAQESNRAEFAILINFDLYIRLCMTYKYVYALEFNYVLSKYTIYFVELYLIMF